MASLDPKVFVDGVGLTTISDDYYTVPTDVVAVIKRATFCNNSSSVVRVTIILLKSGGTASYENQITKEQPISPGKTWSCPDIENHNLDEGSKIYLYASQDGVIGVRISGYETAKS